MQIAKDKVVTIDYTLTDDKGGVIDHSKDGKFAYLHGAQNIIPGLEEALTGKTAGDEINVSITPEDGYGVRDESLKQVVSKDMFPDEAEIEVGRQFHAQSPDAQQVVITIVDVDSDAVTVDGNHPLAGVNLNFDVKIREVRDATNEEIDHGHAHGPGDHHH